MSAGEKPSVPDERQDGMPSLDLPFGVSLRVNRETQETAGGHQVVRQTIATAYGTDLWAWTTGLTDSGHWYAAVTMSPYARETLPVKIQDASFGPYTSESEAMRAGTDWLLALLALVTSARGVLAPDPSLPYDGFLDHLLARFRDEEAVRQVMDAFGDEPPEADDDRMSS